MELSCCSLMTLALAAGIVLYLLVRNILPRQGVKQGGRGKLSRALDPSFETAMISIVKDGNLLLVNVLTFVTKNKLSISTIKTALMRIGQRHPLFRMCVTERDGAYHIEEMENYEIDFSISEETDWVGEFERMLLTNYDIGKGPLWRVVYLPNIPSQQPTATHPHQTVLAFGFHHVIVDGPSYCKLFEEFMTDLEDIENGDTSAPLSLPLPPSMVQCLSTETPWQYRISDRLLRLLLKLHPIRDAVCRKIVSDSTPENPWVVKMGLEADRDPHCEKKTSVVPLLLDSELSGRILSLCKRHKSTVQGALQTAAMGAVAQLIGQTDDTELYVLVTANARTIFPGKFDERHVASYFAAIRKAYHLPSDWRLKFWQCARDTSERLHDNKKSCFHSTLHSYEETFAMLKAGVRGEDIDRWAGNSGRAFPLVFTNLGACPQLSRPAHSGVRLVARYGGSSEHNSGHVLGNNIMSLDGQLFWSVIHYTNVTSRATTQRYAHLVSTILEQACQDPQE